MLHTKYQSSRPYGFRQEVFFMFLPIKAYVYISQCKLCDPLGRANFGLRGIILKVMLHTNYHGSRPNGFRHEDFFTFLPILAYIKHVTPGVGPFWPQGYI